MKRYDAEAMPAPTELLDRDGYLALVRLARQLVDDLPTAEDVVQDVWIRLGHVDPTSITNPKAYVRTAVVNGCRSALRARRSMRKRELMMDLPMLREQVATRVVDPQETVRSDELLRVIDRLPRRQREIVVLRYYEDLTINEIAETLNLTAHAVSASHFLAMKSLRRAIEHQRTRGWK